MIEATWGSGFVCPKCGREATFTTSGALGGVMRAALLEHMMQRLNREGGTLKTDSCGHEFQVKPGSRMPAR